MECFIQMTKTRLARIAFRIATSSISTPIFNEFYKTLVQTNPLCLIWVIVLFCLHNNLHNVIWNNCFRHIFSCCWRDSVRPLQMFCHTLPCPTWSTKANCYSGKNACKWQCHFVYSITYGLSSFHGTWQHIWCNFLKSVSQRDKVCNMVHFYPWYNFVVFISGF